jgi:hypothetical protein
MSRRLVSLGLGAGLLLLTAACQSPSPGITLVSNGRSTHFEAQQWCTGGATLLTGTECPGSGPSHDAVFRVRDGDQVGIDVDRTLTSPGWYLYDVDAKQNVTGIRTDSYYALANVLFQGRPLAGVIHLEVRTVDHAPRSSTDIPRVTGQWKFDLVQES